jgi:hypothetical protein
MRSDSSPRYHERPQADRQRGDTVPAIGERALSNPNRSFVVIPADARPRVSRQEMARHYGHRYLHTEALAFSPIDERGGVVVLRELPSEAARAKPSFAAAPYAVGEGAGATAWIDFGHMVTLKPNEALSLATLEPATGDWSEPRIWFSPGDEGLPDHRMGAPTVVVDPGTADVLPLLSTREGYLY